MGKKYNKY